MLRRIRILLAVVCLLLITGLFLDFTGTLHSWFGWLPKLQFWPAVLALNVGVLLFLLLLTLLCGRIYCSVICPLGVMQDVISHLSGLRKKKKFRFSYSPARNVLRYGVLVLFVAATLAGLGSLSALLAPYSAFGRIAHSLLAPLYGWGNNLLAGWDEAQGSYVFARHEVWLRSIPTLVVAVITLVLLFILAWRSGRSYCNTICPVGTLLGFFSRFSLLRPVIDVSKCNGCTLCSRQCKASCIDPVHHRIDYSRCVTCMDCLGACKHGAISYRFRTKDTATEEHDSVACDVKLATSPADASRRLFLTGAGLALGAVAVEARRKKVDGGLAKVIEKQQPVRRTPIVPPGSEGVRHFYQHCVACQLCVSVCPNHVLRPSTDWTRLMQPESSYERGYCRPECTKCSEVCPTGSIRLLTRAEKSSEQIGHAVWIKQNCLPVTDGVSCGNCARHCPVGAITMVPMDSENEQSPRIPVVDENHCIGCGACEHLCPVRPFSAIYVEGHEQHHTI